MAGIEFLRERYDVRHRRDITATRGYLAGDDARRQAELAEALADDDAVAVVAARGGYGATRILPSVRLDPRRPKWLIGFSDITALHAVWSQAGIGSLHAPMVAWLGAADHESRARWIEAVEGRLAPIRGQTLRAGPNVSAPIVGGNLAVLAALAGTDFLPTARGHAVLIEDVNEAPYRIDRMLTTLLHAGFFEGARVILLGELVDCDDPKGTAAVDVVLERLDALRIGILGHLPVGHGARNDALPLGVVTDIDLQRGEISFPS